MLALGCHFVALPSHANTPAEIARKAVDEFQVTQGTPQTVVVVRPAFAEDGAPLLDLETVFRVFPLDVVAVKAAITRPVGLLLVDVFSREFPDERSAKKARGPSQTELIEKETDVEFCTFLTSRGALLFLAEAVSAAVPPPNAIPQSTNRVVMVAPTAFTSNAEAAQDNHFMHAGGAGNVTAQVLREYSGLHRVLAQHAGVRVSTFGHSRKHDTPDAVFPNNWFSTELSKDGTERVLVLYPLKCQNRQRERRPDIIEAVKRLGAFDKVLDLSQNELGPSPRYLEGTGCIVMDRPSRVAFCAISERCSEELAREWAAELGMRAVCFRTRDAGGFPIYHTNVLMAVGTGFAVVCLESIPDESERAEVVAALAGKETIAISLAQMGAFCGNVLELRDRRGLPVLAASSQAAAAFTAEQTEALLRHVAEIVHAPVETLERIGGGGVRCTLAEVFVNERRGAAQ